MANLNGKRILITRPRPQAVYFAKLLQRHGAQTILLPTIQISKQPQTHALDNALQNLSVYDWIVFTSSNGVDSVWERFLALEIQQIPADVQIAAIGPKTAHALRIRGHKPDFVPEEYILEEIAPGLGDLQGTRILLARGDLARAALSEIIQAKGGQVDDVVAYQTLPTAPDPVGLAAIQTGVDMVTFTSPSAIDNFIKVVENARLSIFELPGNPAFSYIGPVTAQRAQELDLPQDVIAQEYTIEGLTASILEYYAQRERNYA